jgi:hypothetical protein
MQRFSAVNDGWLTAALRARWPRTVLEYRLSDRKLVRTPFGSGHWYLKHPVGCVVGLRRYPVSYHCYRLAVQAAVYVPKQHRATPDVRRKQFGNQHDSVPNCDRA